MSWTHVDVSIPVAEVLERELPKKCPRIRGRVAMLRCTCRDQHCRDPGNQVGLRSNLDFSETTSSLAWAGQGDLEIQTNQKWNHSMDRKTRKQPTNQPPSTLGVANICKPRACVALICRPGKGHRRFYSSIWIGLPRLYKAGFTAHFIVDLFLKQPV